MNINKNYAFTYVKFLAESKSIGWIEFEKKCNNKIINNEDDLIISKLVLLHPIHYEELLIRQKSKLSFESKIINIQGKRNFTKIDILINCESKQIWGYDCPFTNEPKAYDHDFPYSLGGPTKDFNKRILCRWHNMIKANDIHFYNWEKLFYEYKRYKIENRSHWIDIQILKIKKEFNI